MTSNLTTEEQEILDSFERGEWKSIVNEQEEIEWITNLAIENQRRGRRMVSFDIDIDLVEWLTNKAPEDKRHSLINKALRIYIAQLEESTQQKS